MDAYTLFNIGESLLWVVIAVSLFLLRWKAPHQFRVLLYTAVVTFLLFSVSDVLEVIAGNFLVGGMEWLLVWKVINIGALILIFVWYIYLRITAQDGQPVRYSAGGVIVGADGRIVVVRQHHNTWSLPKGGREVGDSDLEETARREIFEETGLKELELVQELGTYDRYSIGIDGVSENHDLPIGRRTFFLFRTSETNFRPTDGEITDLKWMSVEEALHALTHPKDKTFLESVKDKIK